MKGGGVSGEAWDDDRHLMRSWWPQSGAGALALDQITKWVANDQLALAPVVLLPFLELRVTHNSGIAFSLFPAESAIGAYALVAVAMVIMGLLLRWLHASRDRSQQLGLGLVLGGALGNIIDRLFAGSVTDFIHFHAAGISNVFNVADIAISGGVVLILLGSLRQPAGPAAA